MALVDYFLPDTPDYVKMGYESKKYEWAKKSEYKIWQYFINKKIIYSKKVDIHSIFFSIAPFSKFYTSIDSKTPDK